MVVCDLGSLYHVHSILAELNTGEPFGKAFQGIHESLQERTLTFHELEFEN